MPDVKLEILYPLVDKDTPQESGVLDIYDSVNLPLAIQYGIKNITNLKDSQGAYTKTFDIPATKHNNKLLRHVIRDQKVDVSTFVDNSIQCRVSVNGRIVLTGAFSVKGYLKDHKDRGYTISILGDNNNWTTVMGGKMMCELLEEEMNEVHTWTHGLWNWYNANIKVDDVNFPSGMPTYRVAIPHICWGLYEYPHPSNASQYQMHLMEQTPSFFIKNLVYSYFQEAGYDVVSNFMNTKFFKKLIMPTDPQRFNHGNIDTLGGGTSSDIVCIAHSNFYNDTGRGNATDIHFNNTWTGMNYVTNWKWKDCDETDIYDDYDPAFPTQTSNHFVGIGQAMIPAQGNPSGQYWIGERITPYNEEICDAQNSQTLHTHQECRNLNWPNQLEHVFHSLVWGYAGGTPVAGGGVNFFNNHPIQYHNWVCQATGTYTITVCQSVGLMKMANAQSSSRARVMCQLVMHTGYANPNLTDNDWINSLFGTNGTSTVLASTTVQNANADVAFKWKYREIDLTWTGTVPAGAMIYVVTSNINTSRDPNQNKPFQGRAMLMDRDFTKFDAGVETYNMPGVTARETCFKVEGGNAIAYGDEVTWSEYLPCDISQKDFIGGLTGLFNLHWWTDEQAKKVYVEPYDNFYGNKGEAVDWSQKIDMFKKHNTQFLTDYVSRYALYRYLEPTKDAYQQEINKTRTVPYHAQLIDLGDEYINKTETYGTSLFGATVMIGDNQLVPLITPTPPWVPLIVPEWAEDIGTSVKPERGNGYNLRILSYEGMQSTGDQAGYGSWANNGNGDDVDRYPRAISFVESGVPQAGQPHAQLPYHDNATTFAEGLYNTFFGTMFNDIVSLPRMKIAMFHLTPSDIAQLDLRRLVFLAGDGHGNGSYWKIHKVIDYKPHEDGLTKVELLQFQIKDRSKPTLAINDDGGGPDPNDDDNDDDHALARLGNPFSTGTKGVHHTPDAEIVTHSGQSLVMKGNQAPQNNGNIVLGNGLIANDTNQIVMGRFNKLVANAQFVIGGGTSAEDRRNVLTVFNDGSIVMGEESDNIVTTDSKGDYIDLFTEEVKVEWKEGTQTTKTTINKLK